MTNCKMNDPQTALVNLLKAYGIPTESMISATITATAEKQGVVIVECKHLVKVGESDLLYEKGMKYEIRELT